MSSRASNSKLSLQSTPLRKLERRAVSLLHRFTASLPFTLLYIIGSSALLAASLLYVGWHANKVYSNVQDATIYPYLFKDFRLHSLILPGDHPNILKFPLFWLQSILPYNFTTLTLVDLSLLFSTVFGWCLLLARIFGKHRLPILFIFMAAVLLGSNSLTLNLIETTIRNIEYPIGLAFVMGLGRIQTDVPLRRSRMVALVITLVLFTLSFAGDGFMLYAFILPPVIAIGLGWLCSGIWNRRSTIALGVVAIVAVCGVAIRHLVTLLGITSYYVTGNLQTKIIPIDSFGPSLAHAVSQIPDLMGGNVFGLAVTPSNTLYFINFVLLLIGAGGLVSVLRWAFSARSVNTASKFDTNRFTLGALAISAIATFGAYIFSGLAVTRLANGTFVDASNIRYLTLLPFVLVVCSTFVLVRSHNERQPLLWVLSGILVFAIGLSAPSIRSSNIGSSNFVSTSQYDIQSTISILDAHHITQIVAGDSIAAPIRFWSHNQIQFAPLIGCREYAFQNTLLSWRRPSLQPISTALVIDRVGTDRAFMGLCSDAELRSVFGAPSEVIVPSRYQIQPTLFEIWIYHHDIRKSLQANA